MTAVRDRPLASERLFAGSATGFLFLAADEEVQARLFVWAAVAEKLGFSGLLCRVGPDRAAEDAEAAAARLTQLGIERFAVVAAHRDAAGATSVARSPGCRALVLVGPSAIGGALDRWRATRLPRLLVVESGDEHQQQAARTLRQAAAGPIAVRHVPGGGDDDELGGVLGVRAGEAALKFCLPFLGGTPSPGSFHERGVPLDV